MKIDEIYFKVKKAFQDGTIMQMKQSDFEGLQQEERRLKLQDVTDRAIKHAKEQEYKR